MIKIKSSQKLFTDEEVSGLTGICLEHLHALARTRHLGFIVIARAAEAAGEQVEQWLFTYPDLVVLAVLGPRCQHQGKSTVPGSPVAPPNSGAHSDPLTGEEV